MKIYYRKRLLIMNKLNIETLVKLASVVYSDSDKVINYSKKNITRKIIQLSISQSGNKIHTINEITTLIEDVFGLVFMEIEIWGIIKDNEDKFYIDYNSANEVDEKLDIITVALTNKEYIKISKMSDKASLDSVIADFYKKKCDGTISLQKVSKLILEFIFNHFVSNMRNYNNLIHKNANKYSDKFLSEIKYTLNDNYEEYEKIIINDFIDFEDDDKNKYIFYIVTLALEYSLTLNLPSGSIPKEIITKSLYLDSNIIFRAVGINGLNREKKILTFLDKCLETGQTLIISNLTEKEFQNSLQLQCKDLDNFKNASSKSYNYLATDNDVTSTFLRIKSENSNLNASKFRAQVQTDYEDLKVKYKIKLENHKKNSDREDREIEELIDSLYKFKFGDEEQSNSRETCKTDVYNLNDISRKTKSNDLYPCVLFITVDKKLTSWSKGIDKYNNLALSPSDLLSFMLRFVSRSSNEYESFAHLLKITPVNEINFEPIQVRNILNMLNDVEDNQEQQEKIIKQMVKNQFSDVKILSKIDSNDKFTIKADSMIAEEIKNLYEKDIQEIKISAIDIIKEKVSIPM